MQAFEKRPRERLAKSLGIITSYGCNAGGRVGDNAADVFFRGLLSQFRPGILRGNSQGACFDEGLDGGLAVR